MLFIMATESIKFLKINLIGRIYVKESIKLIEDIKGREAILD